jgi:hypothetical protein
MRARRAQIGFGYQLSRVDELMEKLGRGQRLRRTRKRRQNTLRLD